MRTISHTIRTFLRRPLLKQAVDMFLILGLCELPESAFLTNRAAVDALAATSSSATNSLYLTEFETPFIARAVDYYRYVVVYGSPSGWMSSFVHRFPRLP